MLFGFALVATAILIAIIQVAVVSKRPRLRDNFPVAILATTVAFLAGVWLVCASEYRWVDGGTLDTIALPVVIAALLWVWWNRLGRKRD
jgi:amino acid transporter